MAERVDVCSVPFSRPAFGRPEIAVRVQNCWNICGDGGGGALTDIDYWGGICRKGAVAVILSDGFTV